MIKKTPSSLDYETLLHELALRNWRRSLHALDFARAFANAEQLAHSTDRFWKWQGLLDLATTYLARGQSQDALTALESAKSVFPDGSPLRTPVVETQMHVLVEVGRIEEAVATPAPDTELARYHRALAFARLRRPADVERIAAAGAAALAALARGRHDEATQALRATLQTLPTDDAPGLRIPLLFLLGETLAEKRDLEAALAAFETLLNVPDALLHWPIPCVRTHFHRARLRSELGDCSGAKESAETFLRFFQEGDMDRERLERAAQLVKA